MKKARIDTDGNILGVYDVESFLNVNTELVSDWILIEVSLEDIELINQGYKYIDNLWVAPEPIEPIIDVPQTISRMKFIIQVFLTTGIKYEDIVLFIQNLVFNEAQKYIILHRLRSATHFDRNSSDLLTISQMMQITSNQLDEIFTEGNKLD